MKIVVSHPTGNQNVRALISAFYNSGLLMEFHTGIAIPPQAAWLKLVPGKWRKELLRRTFPIPSGKIHTHALLELIRMSVPKLASGVYTNKINEWACIDAVYQNIDKKVAGRLPLIKENVRPNAIYSYEDCSAYSFSKAKSCNMQCLYDLPIGYWRAARALLKIEQQRWPDWAVTITGFNDSVEKLERKDEELRLADKIFVASQFTANTLAYFPGKLPPIKVVPYGFPDIAITRHYSKLSISRPLKLIFVGGLSQRKGIADLFAAVKIFGHHVQLTVVGNKNSENCPALNEELAKHKWIPSLPHHEILNMMFEHDVLVFPSLFEGFGLVITEAMAQGTPVITTERTAGPDIIKSGENGWLIEAGSVQQLQAAIENILLNPDSIAVNGREARETARKRPWEVYGREMLVAINN